MGPAHYAVWHAHNVFSHIHSYILRTWPSTPSYSCTHHSSCGTNAHTCIYANINILAPLNQISFYAPLHGSWKERIKTLCVPSHASKWHTFFSMDGPSQFFPWYWAGICSRVLCWVPPPHVTLQPCHADHCFQTQGTVVVQTELKWIYTQNSSIPIHVYLRYTLSNSDTTIGTVAGLLFFYLSAQK